LENSQQYEENMFAKRIKAKVPNGELVDQTTERNF